MGTENIWLDVHGRISTTNGAGVYYNYYRDATGANRVSANYPGYKARLDVMDFVQAKSPSHSQFYCAACSCYLGYGRRGAISKRHSCRSSERFLEPEAIEDECPGFRCRRTSTYRSPSNIGCGIPRQMDDIRG